MTCVCGHAQGHHGSQPIQAMPYDHRCQWHGCGCPRFLATGNAGAAGRPLTAYEQQLVGTIRGYAERAEHVARLCGDEISAGGPGTDALRCFPVRVREALTDTDSRDSA